MSKNIDYRHDNPEQLNPRAGADLRLRLLTLKDLAHAFLEELDTVGDVGSPPPETPEGPIDFYDEVRRFEIEMIQSALRRTGGVQTEAAALLGLKPSTLHAKIKHYRLSASYFTPRPSPAATHAAPHAGGEPRGGYAESSREEEEDERRRVPVLA